MHAALEYAYTHGRPGCHHPSIVHASVPAKQDLLRLRARLDSAGIVTTEFIEPYRSMGLTAIAFMLPESQRAIVAHLPLWTPGE